MNTIGSRFRETRQAKGLTQAQVASGLCDRSYISLFERDKVSPPADLLTSLAERVSVPLEVLFGGVQTVGRARTQLLYLDDLIAKGDVARAYDYLEQLWWDAAQTDDIHVVYEIGSRLNTILDSCAVDDLSWPNGVVMWLLNRGERERAVFLAHRIQRMLFSHQNWRAAANLGRTLLTMPLSPTYRLRIGVATGSALLRQGDLRQSERYYLDGLRLLNEQAKPQEFVALAWVNHGLSAVHGHLKQWEVAYREAVAASDLYQKAQSDMYWLALQNVGIIQGALGDREQAIHTLTKCKEHWAANNSARVADLKQDLELM